MIRIPEHNDWVILTILGCLFAYSVMFISLLREIRLTDFFLAVYSDSSNTFPSWIITSVVFCIAASVLISQYVPLVPPEVSHLQVFGMELNKFGYTFVSVSLFYLLKTGLSYIFYACVGNVRKWGLCSFAATRFYFGASVLLLILSFVHYYFDIDKREALHYYLFLMAFGFVFKIFFYLFHKNKILPTKWYYKILYICTLQIAPLFALWRVLFY